VDPGAISDLLQPIGWIFHQVIVHDRMPQLRKPSDLIKLLEKIDRTPSMTPLQLHRPKGRRGADEPEPTDNERDETLRSNPDL
jgi:hypothetical protein